MSAAWEFALLAFVLGAARGLFVGAWLDNEWVKLHCD